MCLLHFQTVLFFLFLSFLFFVCLFTCINQYMYCMCWAYRYLYCTVYRQIAYISINFLTRLGIENCFSHYVILFPIATKYIRTESQELEEQTK